MKQFDNHAVHAVPGTNDIALCLYNNYMRYLQLKSTKLENPKDFPKTNHVLLRRL